MIIFIVSLSLLLISIYIVVEVKMKDPLYAFFFKALASLSFILVFGFSIYQQQIEGTFPLISPSVTELKQSAILMIMFGLVSGLIGDLVLALRPMHDASKDKQIIIFGIISFSIGHLFYLSALLFLSTFSYLSIILGVLMTIIIFIGSKVLHFEMGIAKIPTLFYTLLIFMMVGQSIGLAIENSWSTFSILIMSGAILFAVSDLILAPIYYQHETRARFVIFNLATYYAAQVLIALSIYFLI